MTYRKQALTAMLEKVKAGEYVDQAMRVRAGLKDTSVAAFTLAFEGSLDAAKSLHEEVLPGWAAHIHIHGHAEVMHPKLKKHDIAWALAGNPARAWLIAILRALIEKETGENA